VSRARGISNCENLPETVCEVQTNKKKLGGKLGNVPEN